MKSFKNQSTAICKNCKHWRKAEKQPISREVGSCALLGKLTKDNVRYFDNTCVKFERK